MQFWHTIEKDAIANISIAINGLRKNVAILLALQTNNYVLITSYFSQMKQISLVSKLLIIYCLLCATENSYQQLGLRVSSGYPNTSKQ